MKNCSLRPWPEYACEKCVVVTATLVYVNMQPLNTDEIMMANQSRSVSNVAFDPDISFFNQTNRQAYLPNWPPINLEFQDLTYSVPDFNSNKMILRGVSGEFRSGELTAILGPSGAGKSTLLNVMAGFKTAEASGSILVNGQPRNIRTFRKMSRYIMQQSLFQPMLTVREAMSVSANLKLGSCVSDQQKEQLINQILELLRLTKTADTMGQKLSGGEQKRFCIALELVNNPPVIFLDEPTTGLDDLSSSQCMQLLQRIAHGGRTIICSIHTPSAKIFSMFDHVYVVANGQCAYQGDGNYILPFIETIGLNCPVTYNPADFVVEVACGEYGSEYIDRMIMQVENGKCLHWLPESCKMHMHSSMPTVRHCTKVESKNVEPLAVSSTSWQQFCILYHRRIKQMCRDSSYLQLKILMNLFLAVTVSGLYQGVGNDASKALVNFGFCFTVAIAFMYNPMMPVLLTFPSEIELIKREHFNRWFRIGPYYWSMLLAKLPIHMVINVAYITFIYLASDQPLEWGRMLMFYSVSLLIAMTSESLGTLLSSRLSLVNAMFVGPVLTVPLMLLSVYGIGGPIEKPFYIRLIMSLSFLRYGLEGIMAATYGYERADTICPETEIFCMFSNAIYLKDFLGFHNSSYVVSMSGLFMYYLLFTVSAYFMIKLRLSRGHKNHIAVQFVGRFVKNYLNFSSYNY